jgi:hypothetical protein
LGDARFSQGQIHEEVLVSQPISFLTTITKGTLIETQALTSMGFWQLLAPKPAGPLSHKTQNMGRSSTSAGTQ